MKVLFVLLCSFIIVKVSSRLFLKSCESLSLRKLNMISYIFWVDFVVYSYLGSIIIYIFSYLPFNSIVDSVTGGEMTKFYVWASVSYTMIAFPIGMIFSNYFFKFRTFQISNYYYSPIHTHFSRYDSYIKLPLHVLSLICILVVVHVFYSIGSIPIFNAFSLSSEIQVLQLRGSIDLDFPGNVYLKNIFGLYLLPILSYVAFAYYIKTRSISDLIWYLLLLVFTCLILTYNVAKSPLAQYFLGYIIFIICMRGEISKRQLTKYVLLTMTFLIIFFVFLGKKGGFSDLFLSYNNGITGRLLISQISSLYKHFEIFPNTHSYIGFNSISNLFSVNESSERSARIVLQIVSPGWIDNDMGGVFNTLFIGEAFANFGIFGVLIMPIYIGFIIKSFHTLLLNRPKTPLFLGVLVFFSYSSRLTGGVNEYIYNPIIFVLFIILFIVLKSAKYLFNSSFTKVIVNRL